MKKQQFIKNAVGTIAETAVASATLSAIKGANMSYGMGDVTQIGVSAGLAGSTIAKNKKFFK